MIKQILFWVHRNGSARLVSAAVPVVAIYYEIFRRVIYYSQVDMEGTSARAPVSIAHRVMVLLLE